ncbi:MAG: asparagine synthase (glutamine-hydrolyzing) [Burkholderiaceae bacterium]|jgi:asparagine synthase (glutamine-hydrolysing)|nr:asparagine synthase (glutamine-hydrolyzing) [Burkholderiaceae bacterium]
MCGFVAIMSVPGSSPDRQLLARMTELIAHRGPDDCGYFVEGQVGLGFRRLSILDLAASGHQPMLSDDERHVIVFNGEIYNYVELRRELQGLGHRFRSSGDTEVLLAAYRQWGRHCLPRLNGMFAFVIYDRQTRCIFGARDRFGVKPLFVHQTRDGIVFCSEIKSLRDSGYASLSVDRGALLDFLFEGRVDDSDRTFYGDVRRIRPGSAFEVDPAGRFTTFDYWSLPEAVAQTEVPTDPQAAYAALFEDAVRLRMRADVPVGVLLSGGLDSTSIICSMARIGQQTRPALDLNAFCYMSPQFDESNYIEKTLDRTGARLWRLEDDARSLWDDLGRHLWFQDEPVHSFTSVVSCRLMKSARAQGVKVLLNGQGADEVLAGYPSYFADHWADLVSAGRLWDLGRDVRAYGQAFGAQRARRQLSIAAQCAASRVANRLPGRLAASERRRRQRAAQTPWVSADAAHAWQPAARPLIGSLDASLRHSLERDPLPLYLRTEDRNSMAHGVEVRLPFMDYRLITLSFRVGSEWKLRGKYGKHLLREAMKDRIPEPVRSRVDKFGFPNSADHWFRTDLYEPFRDLLFSRSVREAGLWDVEAVGRDLERHRRGECALGSRLFDVAQISLWLEGSQHWPHERHVAPSDVAA